MAEPPPSQPPPDSGGIHIGDVGGSVNFSALGDIVGGDKITTITTTIQISVEAVTQRPLITASPYRGLDRFEDRDKDLFFGRDQLIKSLLAQLSASNVLLVLGASGSGKSSVVRAGLLPQLAQLIGAKFRYFTFVPDVNPFESLRATLLAAGFSQAQTRELADARPETPSNLIHALQRIGDQWLFFVDQFEEIFTVGDEKLRASFVEALVQIAQDPNSSTKLVLAMRADFLDRFSPFPQFAKIIEKNIDFVADMHPDELRLAIEQPAARHGVVFEQGLVEEIIKDVQGQAGSLPLLQYTLDLLWQEEAREDALADRHLNARAYRELGGVRGALQKRADEIYDSFGDGSDAKAATPKQEIVRQIFLRLVDLAGEGSNDAAWRPVRRRASMTMFVAAQEQEILQALVNQKLLVSNREGDDATVEVAHEALFTSWGRLKNWIEAGKQVIFARNRLADDARRWQRRQREGDGDADEELLAGSRLSQALDMRTRGDFNTVVGGLGETEAQFLDASAVLRDRRRQEEQERQQRELAQAQALAAEQKKRGDDQAKAAARLRWFTWAMVGVSLLALVAAVFAWTKQREAAQQARIALSRELAAAATHSDDADLKVILAREAVTATYSVDKTVTAEAAEVLRKSVPPEPTTLSVGHRNPISALAFSPDGKRLVTASEEAVKIWNAASGDELCGVSSLPKNSFGNYGKLIGVAFSGDGERLVWCSTLDAKIWDSFSGRELFAEPQISGLITGFAFSQDGRHIAISRGYELRLWDISSRKQLWLISSDKLICNSNPVFSPDGNSLAICNMAVVQFLDASSGKELKTLTNHVDFVRRVVFSPDGKRVATVSGLDGETVKVWDFASQKELLTLSNQTEEVTDMAFSPDCNRLVVASDAKVHTGGSHSKPTYAYADHPSVVVWNIASKSKLLTFPKQTSTIWCLAYNPDGTQLATASSSEVCQWNAVSGVQLHKLAGKNSVSFNKDGKLLASPGEAGQAKVWDLTSGSELLILPGQADLKLDGGTFSPDRQRLATKGSDGKVRVWDLKIGQRLSTIHSGPADAIAFSPDGMRLGISTDRVQGAVTLFDAVSGVNLQTLKGHGRILSVAFSPDGTKVAAGSNEDEARLWDATSGHELRTLNSKAVCGVVFSPDGTRVATVNRGSEGMLWETASGRSLISLSNYKRSGFGLLFSPDGTRLATENQMWDSVSGHQLFTLEQGDSGGVGLERIGFSPDGKLFAKGGRNAKLWDASSGNEVLTFEDSAKVNGVAFSRDGKYLATVCEDWTVRWHPLQIEELLALAQKQVPRELSVGEREKYLHTKSGK